MDTLNEDCIVQILQYLSLKDQIAVLLSNESLIGILEDLWKIKYQKLLLVRLNTEMPLEIYELKQFLSVVHPYIENLHLKLESKNMIDVLKGFKFIKTSKLHVTVGSSEMLEHEFVAILHDIFPNVKLLQPNGKFTGAGFVMWKNLEQLTLTSCYIFRFHYLERILQELPLNTLILKSFKMIFPRLADDALQHCTLRVLVLNSYELSYFTPQLKNLQHLKELNISDLYSIDNLNSLHKKLGEIHHTRHIKGIHTRDITEIFPNIINYQMHTHLMRLTLVVDPLAFSDMLIYICLLPALRVLHFYACYVRSEVDFQKLFLASVHLDEISLEGCMINYGSNPCLNVNEVVKNRTKPITFNFYANILNGDNKMAELQMTGSSDLFTLECKQKLLKRCGYLVYEFG